MIQAAAAPVRAEAIMHGTNRRKLAMAARVVEFSRVYPSEQPSHREALGRLLEAMGRAEALAARQAGAAILLEEATARREEVRRTIRTALVPRLTRTVRSAPAGGAEAGELARTLRGAVSDRGFLAAARRFLTLSSDNWPDATLPADLARAADELERAGALVEECCAVRDGAARELVEVVGEIASAVGQLDRLNRHRFRADGALLEAWAAACNASAPFQPRSASSDGAAPAA